MIVRALILQVYPLFLKALDEEATLQAEIQFQPLHNFSAHTLPVMGIVCGYGGRIAVIVSSSDFTCKKCIDKLKEGDEVKVLDPFDGDVVGIARIHSISIVHGVNLKGTIDANVNILKVTSNVPFAYEEKIDGANRLKEKEGSFTRWPLKYLQKMST